MVEKQYRYVDVITAAFVTVLLCSNLIGTAKITTFFGFRFTAAVILFPVSYIFGDVLTEVYGYARSRRVVWLGFGAMSFASLVSLVVVALPTPDPAQQRLVEAVFAQTPRIFVASLVAYFFGELINSYVLARMKVLTQGRLLWARTIGSTILGEAVDSALFYPLAFWGVWPSDVLLGVSLGNYVFKVALEVVLTPLTYVVVARLKAVEGVDVYDRETDFNPFHLG